MPSKSQDFLSVCIEPHTGDIAVTCLEGHCGAGNNAGSVELGGGQAVLRLACHAGKCTAPTIGPMRPEQLQRKDSAPSERVQVWDEKTVPLRPGAGVRS